MKLSVFVCASVFVLSFCLTESQIMMARLDGIDGVFAQSVELSFRE